MSLKTKEGKRTDTESAPHRKSITRYAPLITGLIAASVAITAANSGAFGQGKGARYMCTARVQESDEFEGLSMEASGEKVKNLRSRIPRIEGGHIEISFPDAYADSLMMTAKKLNEADRYKFLQGRLSEAISRAVDRIKGNATSAIFECPIILNIPLSSSSLLSSSAMVPQSCDGDYYLFMPWEGTSERERERIRIPINLELHVGTSGAIDLSHLMRVVVEFSAYHLSASNRRNTAQALRSKITPILSQRCRDVPPYEANRVLNRLQGKLTEAVHSACLDRKFSPAMCDMLGELPPIPSTLTPSPFQLQLDR